MRKIIVFLIIFNLIFFNICYADEIDFDDEDLILEASINIENSEPILDCKNSVVIDRQTRNDSI